MSTIRSRKWWLPLLLVPLALVLAMGSRQSALALVGGNASDFGLDGNPQASGTLAGDDWSNVGGQHSAIPIVDPLGTTIFTTGGSKDDLDISNWRHTGGSVPDKD